MIHDYPDIAKYVDKKRYSFNLFYWATKKGYNSIIKQILSQFNSPSLINSLFNEYSLLDIAIAKNNIELIEIYRSLGIKSKEHPYPIASIIPKCYFASSNNIFAEIKISYDRMDYYESIFAKMSYTDDRSFGLSRPGSIKFRGRKIEKGEPIYKYGIKPGNIFYYSTKSTGMS